MEKIVCDASSLISLSENCMLELLPAVEAEFVIPETVKRELVDKPLSVTEFQLKALKLRHAIEEGFVKVVSAPGVEVKAKQILKKANSLFTPKVRILHQGEAECLALLQKMHSSTLLVDERTTRLIIENPRALSEYIQNKVHSKLEIDEETLADLHEEFKGVRVIRSSELVAFAYQNGFFDELGDGRLLHACLYALKYSGCAITRREIDEYLRMFRVSHG